MISTKIKVVRHNFNVVLDEVEVNSLEHALNVFITTKKYDNLCPADKDVIKDLLREINNFHIPF